MISAFGKVKGLSVWNEEPFGMYYTETEPENGFVPKEGEPK
jgi:hypothetical protein